MNMSSSSEMLTSQTVVLANSVRLKKATDSPSGLYLVSMFFTFLQ